VAAEASISPECCLAVHSPPELRHTKVYTPMPAGRWSSARAAAEVGGEAEALRIGRLVGRNPSCGAGLCSGFVGPCWSKKSP
jgi:hypothetical protein